MLDKKHYDSVIKALDEATLPRYKKNKKCKECGGFRWVGFDSLGRLIMCNTCVNRYAAVTWWIEYVSKNKDII